MKAIYLHAAGAVALSFAIAACVPQAKPPAPTPPPVVQAPAPTPTPTPVPVVQEPTYGNYLDAPQTAGDWYYLEDRLTTHAIFAASDTEPLFALSCSLRGVGGGVRMPMITLSRKASGEGERAIQIKTETAVRELAGSAPSRRVAAFKGMNLWDHMAGSTTVVLDPRDPILDAMAITKGRFAVGVEGERTLYIPAWVEVSRVIEDCR